MTRLPLVLVWVCVMMGLVMATAHRPPPTEEITLLRRQFEGELRSVVTVYVKEIRDTIDVWLHLGTPVGEDATEEATAHWRLPHASLHLFRASDGGASRDLTRHIVASRSALRSVFWATARGHRIQFHVQLVSRARDLATDELLAVGKPANHARSVDGMLFLGPHSLVWETYRQIEIRRNAVTLRRSPAVMPSNALRFPVHCDRMLYRIRPASVGGKGAMRTACVALDIDVTGFASVDLVLDAESARSYLPPDLYVIFYDPRGTVRPLGVGDVPESLVLNIPGPARGQATPLTLFPSGDDGANKFHLSLDESYVVLGADILMAPSGPTIILEPTQVTLDYTHASARASTIVKVASAALMFLFVLGTLHWATSDYGHIAPLLWDPERRTRRPNRLGDSHPMVALGLELGVLLAAITALVLAALVPAIVTDWWSAWGALVALVVLVTGIQMPAVFLSLAAGTGTSLRIIRLLLYGQVLVIGVLASLLPALTTLLALGFYVLSLLGGLLLVFIELQTVIYLSLAPPSTGFFKSSIERSLWAVYGISRGLAGIVYVIFLVGISIPRALDLQNVQYGQSSLLAATAILFAAAFTAAAYLLYRASRAKAAEIIASHGKPEMSKE